MPPPRGVGPLAEVVRRRHAGVLAVLFYGSCLRKRTSEGVIDFYVLVEDYRAAYRSTLLAWANQLLPPNVFHLEADAGGEPLRCKYAVISLADFLRRTSWRSLQPTVWARFSQPAALVWARDERAREAVGRGCAGAVRTMVECGLAALPGAGDRLRFSAEALWSAAIGETRRAEWRVEPPGRSGEIVAAAASRYRQALSAALTELERDGRLRVEATSPRFEVAGVAARRTACRRRLARRRPVAKGLCFVQLVKTGLTFGDWVPYVLWKIERHTGARVVLSSRQRRHPWIFGWPVLLRLVWRRVLR